LSLDRFLKDHHSRRGFIHSFGVTLGGGTAALLAACGGDGGDDSGGRESDIDLLNGALDLEYAAVAAYEAGIKRLEGDLLRTGKSLLEHERAHADALSSAITELGGTPGKARASYPFPDLGSENLALRFARDVELTQIAAYVEVIPKLSSSGLRASAAQIVTAEAEHLSVLLGALGRPQLPAAFVKGERKLEL
jgi:rubrerythrin